MLKAFLFIFIVFCSSFSFAVPLNNVEKFRWDDLEIVWLPEERHPTYVLTVYFADGALSDGADKGTTETMFNLISSGTRRFSQKDIADNLEFFFVYHG
jgi:zinc protease